MKRVMCIWFPQWPLQRLFTAQPELKHRPVVLSASGPGGRLQVVVASRSAAARGVVAGIPLAEARMLLSKTESRGSSPQAYFENHDMRADRDALRALAVWCREFSPVVGLEESEATECLLLEITGCAHLFGGERNYAAHVVSRLSRCGLRVRIAIADTIGAAWAFVHYAQNTSRPGEPSGHQGKPLPVVITPPNRHVKLLQSLPVEALRVGSRVVETLRALDVRTVGQLQKLPRSSLPSRFGPKVLQRLNQALGDHPEQIVPERLAEPIEAEWVFEHPLADRRTIGSVLQQLIERVTIQLTAQNVAARRLDCRLRCENNRALDFSVSLVKPSAVAAHLRELMLLKLDRLTIDGLVTGIHLEVAKTGPLEIRERELFESGVNREHAREQAALLERLSSRLGERAVLRPHLSPDAQPEYGFRYEPVMRESTSRPEKTLQPDAQRTAPIRYGVSVRPLHLYPRPMPVEVMSVVPEGPPIRFHWKNREHVIVRSWGPERIETGWWRGRHIERDYYRVETEAGRRFWLFRGANDDEWFLHGAFE